MISPINKTVQLATVLAIAPVFGLTFAAAHVLSISSYLAINIPVSQQLFSTTDYFNIAFRESLFVTSISIVTIMFYVTRNVVNDNFYWITIGCFILILTYVVYSIGFSRFSENFTSLRDQGNFKLPYIEIFLTIIFLSVTLFVIKSKNIDPNVKLILSIFFSLIVIFLVGFSFGKVRGQSFASGASEEITIYFTDNNTMQCNSIYLTSEWIVCRHNDSSRAVINIAHVKSVGSV